MILILLASPLKVLCRKLKKSEDTQASLQAELSSVKADIERLKRLRAEHKLSLHCAASGGAAAALGASTIITLIWTWIKSCLG